MANYAQRRSPAAKFREFKSNLPISVYDDEVAQLVDPVVIDDQSSLVRRLPE